MSSIDLGALANFTEGKPERVTASDRAMLVVRRGDDVYALRDLCPHQGDDIRMERTGEVVVCPWHGWEFNVQTGRSLCDPQKTRVRSYVTRVEHGRVFVEMD